MNPRVTAVVPLHNHAQWVGGALASIAQQDYRPLRIIVVDDGSTDNSRDEVLSFLQEIQLPEVQEEPWVALGKLSGFDLDVLLGSFKVAGGPAAARNWGIKVGWPETDYFAFLDSDDEYLPGKISESVRRFSPEVGVVYSDYDTFRPDGLRLRQYKEPYNRYRLLAECIINCDSLVSRAALEKVGLFDEELRCVEDYDLWLRLTEHFTAEHIAEALVAIRVGPHSSSTTVSAERWNQCHQRVIAKTALRARGGRA